MVWWTSNGSGGFCESDALGIADRISCRESSLYPAGAGAASLPQAPVAATSVAGSDIGDRVNHALKTCALQCTVYIPPGNYSFSVAHPPGAEYLWQLQAER